MNIIAKFHLNSIDVIDIVVANTTIKNKDIFQK